MLDFTVMICSCHAIGEKDYIAIVVDLESSLSSTHPKCVTKEANLGVTEGQFFNIT